jgi:hypothetical protein
LAKSGIAFLVCFRAREKNVDALLFASDVFDVDGRDLGAPKRSAPTEQEAEVDEKVSPAGMQPRSWTSKSR